MKRTTLQSRMVKLGIGGRQKNIVQPSAAQD